MTTVSYARPLLAAAALLAACSFSLDGLQDCEVDADCRYLGDDVVCVQPELFCATDPDPFRPDCRTFVGETKDPKAIRLGAVLPLTDAAGKADADGEALARSLQLALEEINASGGLGTIRFNLRVCDTHGDATRAAEEAGYLTSRGIVAVFSGNDAETLATAPKAIAANALLMSVASTKDGLGELDDDGLVWRTAPNELSEGAALGALVAAETGLRRIALASTDEPRAAAAAAGFARGFAAVDGAIEPIPLGNEGALDAALAATVAAAPDAIVVTGSVDVIAPYVKALRSHAPLAATPLFFAGLAADASLFTAIGDASLLEGARGTMLAEPSAEARDGFRSRYGLRFGADPSTSPFTAHAYDALYCTALAAAASAGPAGDAKLDGQRLAAGLSKLVDGTPSLAGPLTFAAMRGTLQRGWTVDVDGASGRLAFVLETGDTRAAAAWRIVGGRVVPDAAP